ncbi:MULTISPECIES: hypothetical protein [Sphingomonadales]|jgi:hypothetical protein|uniref:hypothetical protein n=1 Tax=Sphingomonadales TaxID=204457 RepID=UPI000B8C3A56|nr:hypothetical protein CHH26_03945 [Qipengyuania flava]PNQ77551.1 hypothetical protein BA950_00435 [Erythrobacter sp. SAORIC-644]|tara:strand:- start:363 stop:791 length:429 start_codon:yes stop_codon:yes gene_type:complete
MPHNSEKGRMRTDRQDPRPSLGSLEDHEGVTVSFAHYRAETECLSSWNKADLKSFVGVVEKLRTMDVTTLRNSSLCSPHRGEVRPAKRFTRPDTIGKDYRMHEIRVDRSNTARMHGVIEESVFYLVWLDRKHEVFPWRKNKK